MAEFAENLKEELTCLVCVDYFSHPVTLNCGHSFCYQCLLRSREETNQACSCPLCRRAFQIRDLEPNCRLGKLEQVHAWRESIRVQYKQVHEFLKNEEKWHLYSLGREGKPKEVITDLEQNNQKPDLQLLQVVGDALNRSESLLSHHPEAAGTQVSMSQITGIWEMMKHFRGIVTLDPESACPYLIVSKDRKTVTHGGCQQNTPIALHQFEDSSILGAQVFTFGMHYWEVDVGDSREWSLGVCKASLSRNANVPLGPGDVFLLTCFLKGNTYSVMTTPLHIEHQSDSHIRKVGMFLDYDQGHISFYDALKTNLIFHFPLFHFSEPLKPMFCPCPPMGEENGIPMTINP
ncbi:probable E3 ubiquitin-protein ligase TRIML1 [Vombatus ursinus]|uniref:probable E3 ubiquitin-protein ligase TRIML1 n=1 Tax=Vombatus ursinus TaxID=29139 RepID=UPI000FFD0F07|nr:probable E3 ubiquitin-protein ligase TRIML1 [Vombatus ursinus]